MPKVESTREQVRYRIAELGQWLIEYADALSRELDDVLVERDGVAINADIDLNGISSIKVVKNYIGINKP